MPLELDLKKAGFSDKEAKVYLALLQLGSAPVQEIAQKAGVNRVTTYVVLDNLKKRGIVSTVEREKKLIFAAENPHVLTRLFRAQEEELKDKENDFKRIIPELEGIFNLAQDKPRVRFFEVKEGVSVIQQEIIRSGEKLIYNIYNLEYAKRLREMISSDYKHFVEMRNTLGIAIKSIYTSETGPQAQFITKGERRFVPKDKFPFSSDIIIFGNNVAITTLKGKTISVIIESEEIANTLRLIFDLAWLGAESFDKAQ